MKNIFKRKTEIVDLDFAFWATKQNKCSMPYKKSFLVLAIICLSIAVFPNGLGFLFYPLSIKFWRKA